MDITITLTKFVQDCLETTFKSHSDICKECIWLFSTTKGDCSLYSLIAEKYNYKLTEEEQSLFSKIDKKTFDKIAIQLFRDGLLCQ